MNGVTQDFVDSFKDETDFSGVFFRMILMGETDEIMRPEGLDYDHPAVVAILAKVRHKLTEAPWPVNLAANGAVTPGTSSPKR